MSSKRKFRPEGLQEYEGCNYFKQRLICSLLSKKPVTIKNFRPGFGFRECELSLLSLIEKITDKTKITITSNNNEIHFEPGFLQGGEVMHECDLERGIGYYLELMIAIAPFCREAIHAKLLGVTNSKESTSVDFIQRNTMFWLKEIYNIKEGMDLKIIKRGMIPDGGGEIIFDFPVLKEFPPIQIIDEGVVRKVRGIAYSCKVPASVGNRIVEAVKGFFLDFTRDVYIHTDQYTGKPSGNSPGYGIYLEALTTTDVLYSTEVISEASLGQHESAEDMGFRASQLLMEEIYRGGVVDSANQWLIILFMALSRRDVSKVIVGDLNDYAINFLRHLDDFFHIKFKIQYHRPDDDDSDSSDEEKEKKKKDDEEGEEKEAEEQNKEEEEDTTKPIGANNPRVLLACAGLGYANVHRQVL